MLEWNTNYGNGTQISGMMEHKLWQGIIEQNSNFFNAQNNLK